MAGKRAEKMKQTEKAKEKRWFKCIFKEANSANDKERREDNKGEDKIEVKICRF